MCTKLRNSPRAMTRVIIDVQATADYHPSFMMLNRGKRSVGIDMKVPEGRAALLRMVEQADVLTENFRFGVMERLNSVMRFSGG